MSEDEKYIPSFDDMINVLKRIYFYNSKPKNCKKS